MIALNVAYEDPLSLSIIEKLLRQFDDMFFIKNGYSKGGNDYLKQQCAAFNDASTHTPFFMLVDLDRHECPPTILSAWLKRPRNNNFIFRVAVKEVEAWLLADKEGLSKFFNVSPALFSPNPDALLNPKHALITLAKRSRKRDIRDDITPIDQSASIGPNYNNRLSQFVDSYWNIANAKKRSPSLCGAYDALQKFQINKRLGNVKSSY